MNDYVFESICEGEKKEGSLMTLGPRPYHRCANPTTMTVEEIGYAGGKEGIMSMCDSCYKVFLDVDNRPHVRRSLIFKCECVHHGATNENPAILDEQEDGDG